MNKRQAKKHKKKVVIPFFIMDEMHLSSMTEEEREVFYKARKEFIKRHCHYKHYRDKINIKIDQKKWFEYAGFTPITSEEQFENLFKNVRKRRISLTIVKDDLLKN